jgi:hypothetical protein
MSVSNKKSRYAVAKFLDRVGVVIIGFNPLPSEACLSLSMYGLIA